MVENLNGTWKLSGGDSPSEYLRAVGCGLFLRTIASHASPTVEIDVQENCVCIQTSVAVKSFETSGNYDEEFDEAPPDHKKCRTLFYVAGEVLMQEQRWDNHKVVIKRHVNTQDEMIMEIQIGSVKCRRIFSRTNSPPKAFVK